MMNEFPREMGGPKAEVDPGRVSRSEREGLTNQINRRLSLPDKIWEVPGRLVDRVPLSLGKAWVQSLVPGELRSHKPHGQKGAGRKIG